MKLTALIAILVLVVFIWLPRPPEQRATRSVTSEIARSLAAETQEMIVELQALDKWKSAKEIERLELERDAWLEYAATHTAP